MHLKNLWKNMHLFFAYIHSLHMITGGLKHSPLTGILELPPKNSEYRNFLMYISQALNGNQILSLSKK